MAQTYWEVANSGIIWLLVSLGLACVAGLAALFFFKSKKRCEALGISKQTVKKVIASTISFSVVPIFAMLIGFLTLASALGVPLSWFRLSVVGATAYELMAADMVSAGMGYANLVEARGASGTVFLTVMLVMAVGIIGGIVTNIFVGKKITTSMTSYTKKNAAWGAVFSGCFMMTMMGVFLPNTLSRGWVALLTMLSGAAIAIGCGFIAKKANAKWLDDFVLSFALLGGMALSVFWTHLLA